MKRKHSPNKSATEPQTFTPLPPHPAISADAIQASRGIDRPTATQLSRQLSDNKNYRDVLVAVLDIRESTRFMLHVDNFDLYAQLLSNFVAYVRYKVNSSNGWFDKFTGDGALVFWTPPEGAEFGVQVMKAIDCIVDIQAQFIGITIPNLRQISGCVPENFGLSVGIDLGRCLLSDLPYNRHMVSGITLPAPISHSVTVLGRAVVGAARMVAAAGANQVILNERPADLVGRALATHKMLPATMSLTRILVHNKDLAGNQYAYSLGHLAIAQVIRRHLAVDSPVESK